jgi:hypothetical protein
MVHGHGHVEVEVRVYAQDHLRGRLLVGVGHHHVRRAPFDVAVTSQPEEQERTDVCAVRGRVTGGELL